MADATTGTRADERELIAELVLATLEDAAPEEVAVFRGDRDEFLDGHVPGAARGDEELGFGVEAVALLTPFVVAAAKEVIRLLANAFAQSVQDEAQSAFSGWLHRVLHRHADAKAGGDPAPMAPETVERVRAAAFHVCVTMGAPNDDAELVADAIAGRFATGAAG